MDSTHAPIEQAVIRLDDNRMMPQLGFGTWKIADEDAERLVASAIGAGYRAIDTASIYHNEAGVGRAIANAGVPRDQLHVTSKLWNEDQGFDSTLTAFDATMERLGLDELDLYLIHWPCPTRGLAIETWKAFVRLQAEGRIRSIGVSNFRPTDLERIIDDTGVVPVVNQIELHPRFQQVELRAFHDENGIATTSWSPLGRAEIFDDPVVVRIAEKHDRAPAQVVIRWHLDLGLIVIPKAADARHMTENLAVGGFALDEEDMAAMATLDSADGRRGEEPGSYC